MGAARRFGCRSDFVSAAPRSMFADRATTWCSVPGQGPRCRASSMHSASSSPDSGSSASNPPATARPDACPRSTGSTATLPSALPKECRRACSARMPPGRVRRRVERQPPCSRREPRCAEGAAAVLSRPGQVHLHRPAVQHEERVRALRRQPRTLAVADDGAAAPAVAARAAQRRRVDLGDDRRQRGALPQGVDGRGVRTTELHNLVRLAEDPDPSQRREDCFRGPRSCFALRHERR